MFKRKLFKRALPIILSVAMVFQSAPTTSLAAEGTTEPETVIEQTTGEAVSGETDVQLTSEEKQAEEPKTEETTGQTPADEAKKEAEADEEQVDVQADGDDDVQELPASEIVFEFDQMAAPDKSEFSVTEKSFTAVYDAGNEAGKEALERVKSVTCVDVDTTTDTDEHRKDLAVTYQWQAKNEQGEWADCDTPEVTGEYRIKVSLAEQAGLCKAAEDAFVNFTIEKKEIKINPVVTSFDAGIEASEVVAKITEKYTVDVPAKDVGVVKDQTTIKIREAVSGKELAATDKLQDSVSYVVEFNVVLTDEFAKNYRLSEDPAKYTFNIKTTVKNATVSVEIKDGVTLGKKWDDQAITLDDIAEDITSFKVEAVETDNEVKKVLTTDIKDENVTLTWKDSNNVEIEAPTDAGQYTLEIGYEDDNHNVAPAKLRVVIDPVDIIVVPKLDEADQNVADGDKVDDILKKVTYEIYEVVDGNKSEKAMTVDEYFWGEYEEPYDNAQQYYQPRAVVQVGTQDGSHVVWTTLEDYQQISSDETKQYRVVFDGDLVVYDENDNYHFTNKTDNVQKNYRADLTDAVKNANSVVLTVAASTEVVIDVSDILKDKKGDSYDNAIISTCNGNGIYKTKADYKKAKLADKDGNAVESDKEKDFEYQWQYIEYDAENEVVYPYNQWYDWDVEAVSAPFEAGNYRLEITYIPTDDKGTIENTYRAKEKAYVYYTILPQDAIVEVTGAPEAYADGVTTIGDYLAQVKSDNNVGIKLYTYDKEAKTAGEEIALDVETRAEYMDYLTVMVKAIEGENSGEFVECDSIDKFEAEREYVLCISDWIWLDNFNLGYDLDSHGFKQSYNKLWSNAEKGSPIEVKDSQGIQVNITIDPAQIKNKSQEYDGKAFDLTEIKSLVKITNVKTGEDLTEALKDQITYQFENIDESIKVYDRYDDSDAYKVADKEIVKDGDVIHGGTYRLVAKLEATEVYAPAINPNVTGGYIYENIPREYITITPKELVVTPKVKDEVKAGLVIGDLCQRTSTGSNVYTDDIIADIPDTPDGYIGDDADGILGYYINIHHFTTFINN